MYVEKGLKEGMLAKIVFCLPEVEAIIFSNAL
jgi:hypothetical protein